MKELGETFKNNTSAIFVLVRKVTPDKVLEELKGFKGKVLKTSLTKDKEEELRKFLEAGLNSLIGARWHRFDVYPASTDDDGDYPGNFALSGADFSLR
jgi:hypothetical protein